MSSSSSSSSSNLSFDHHQLPPHSSSSSSSTDQLCYVHCTLCDTVLAVLISNLPTLLHPFSIIYHIPVLLGFLFPFLIRSWVFFLWGFWLCVFYGINRWVFLAPACSRPSRSDAATAQISSLWACEPGSLFLLRMQISFISLTLSSLLIPIIFW